MSVESIEDGAGMILSEGQARRTAERLLGFVTADDAVVNLNHSRESTVRFSGNAIAQNIHCDRLTARLTVAFENRKGTASVDAIDDDSLRALARRAEEIARLTPPDPEFLPSLGAQEYLPVAAYFEDAARLSEVELGGAARQVIAPAAAAGLQVSGTVEASVKAECVATSNGLFAYHAGTRGEVGCTVATGDSTGWARDTALRLGDLRPDRVAEQAIASALRARSPRPIEPGRYTTLFLPSAVNHLASVLVWLASARYALEGLTYLSGRDDRKLAADVITIRSDPQDPRFPSSPFDSEGVPRRRTLWVDRGNFDQMWWERWTAHDQGVEPVPPPEHLFMDGSDRLLEDLVAGVDRGVLVTRFWYVRFVKQDQTLVTGMTRDGTFRIEDGRIVHPLKNLRFNDTCLGMLSRVEAIGTPQRCTGTETNAGYFPSLVVRDWNFVGVTEF
jgi:predicted Zn-dependent protease